jgi:hypothetical protein
MVSVTLLNGRPLDRCQRWPAPGGWPGPRPIAPPSGRDAASAPRPRGRGAVPADPPRPLQGGSRRSRALLMDRTSARASRGFYGQTMDNPPVPGEAKPENPVGPRPACCWRAPSRPQAVSKRLDATALFASSVSRRRTGRNPRAMPGRRGSDAGNARPMARPTAITITASGRPGHHPSNPRGISESRPPRCSPTPLPKAATASDLRRILIGSPRIWCRLRTTGSRCRF